MRAVDGWRADYEVAAEDGSWRADVMATGPGGRRIALETQLASIAVTDIEARTTRYQAESIECCWFTDRKTVPWLDNVPAARVQRPEDGGEVVVTAGPARFVSRLCDSACGPIIDGTPLACPGHGTWQDVDPFQLARFVAGLCHDTTRLHHVRIDFDPVLRWVTRPYRALEEQQRRAHAFFEQAIDDQAQINRRHRQAIHDLIARQDDLKRPVEEYLYARLGFYPELADRGDPAFAMGVPVHVNGRPYAVICPVANCIAFRRAELAPLILFAATERECDRIAAQALAGQRIEVIPRPQSQ
ncbi:hypothetical protein ACIQC7_33290 [Kitasatospora sp. NPDC088556]|uniref:competence protein CoiA family protein n=1 Tax=Kitasatospora sp. NPDC088556 TaxID=3364076 RepID=UPI00382B28A0